MKKTKLTPYYNMRINSASGSPVNSIHSVRIYLLGIIL